MKIPENRDFVELHKEDGVPHDILAIGWILGFHHEASKCARRAGDFLRHLQTEGPGFKASAFMPSEEKNKDAEDENIETLTVN